MWGSAYGEHTKVENPREHHECPMCTDIARRRWEYLDDRSIDDERDTQHNAPVDLHRPAANRVDDQDAHARPEERNDSVHRLEQQRLRSRNTNLLENLRAEILNR